MSINKHHQEWLSLLEISGPFLAMPVITKVFPHGLPKLDSAIKKELRIAYQEWLGSQEDANLRTSYQTAWIRFVLREVLGFPSELIAEGQSIPPGYNVVLSEHGEQLSPDAVIIVPKDRENGGRARALFASYPSTQQLERAVPPSRSKWGASPATRMMELLRRTSTEVGLVTNGEQWMLVYAPAGETTTFSSWYASIWMEEDVTLLSFHALLSAARLFGVSADETLEALFRASTEFQQEVTDQLGLQVRKAVELLIQALDRIDKDTGRSLLRDVSEKQLYEAGVSVLMRLVFLLAAEERGLFPLNNEIYSTNYAVSTLREQLQESASRHGESVLEHRFDAWNRLLATFRVIHAGSRHEDFNSPAYGGSLFDPDKYPFLEGRLSGTKWFETEVDPLAINNRTVLHMLDSLQLLKGRGPKDEARKLSFRAIDVEQIGNVYESLLEHTAVRATEPVLGLLGSKGKEPEVPLSSLQSRKQAGETILLQWLAEQTGKTDKALSKLLYQADKFPESTCLMVCDNDSSVYTSVRPFLGLVREDTLDMPVVFTPGSVYVTESSERRSTGTHYTPRSLTEPIVEYALNPLVYSGLSAGNAPTPDTLRSPTDILELKICDMTCGSGAFLVQTCRYLAEKLVDSWASCETQLEPGCLMNIEGSGLQSEGAIDQKQVVPADTNDRIMFARRLIADRCLYGVDCNPMAVEMAKLSLWLTTLQRNRPFTFVDHAIKCGDSLIGITDVDQLRYFDVAPDKNSTLRRLSEFTSTLIQSAQEKRIQLERIAVADICDTEVKERLHKQAEADLKEAKCIGDLIVGISMEHATKPLNRKARLDKVSLDLAPFVASGSPIEKLEHFRTKQINPINGSNLDFNDKRPFHWVLEFPEVFSSNKSGFDAVIGNPPFIRGSDISGNLGSNYREFLVEHLAAGQRGNADLCAFFFLRANTITGVTSSIGLLATNTICQGDTREIGLDRLISDGRIIYRAVKSRKWSGSASLEVSEIWLWRGPWNSTFILDDTMVPGITTYLTSGGSADAFTGKPLQLAASSGKCVYATYVLGLGFTMTETEAKNILLNDLRADDVLRKYLSAEDVASRVNQDASRWIINFWDWPLDRLELEGWSVASKEQQRDWIRSGLVPADYPGQVAADYPECLRIVVEKVKPERDAIKGADATSRDVSRRWWQYKRPTTALYQALSKLDRCLVITRVSKFSLVSWQSTHQIFADSLVVVTTNADCDFALLQSSIHEIWARQCGSTLETRMRYTPSDCFDTFPFPNDTASLHDIGRRYHDTRQKLIQKFQEGLTKVYNRVHSRKEKDASVIELRTLHAEMDKAVLLSYGWSDITLDHDFRSTERGEVYTISEQCKQQILGRLFLLNQERHALEESKGLGKVKKKNQRTPKKPIKSDGSDNENRTDTRQMSLDLRNTTSIGAAKDE